MSPRTWRLLDIFLWLPMVALTFAIIPTVIWVAGDFSAAHGIGIIRPVARIAAWLWLGFALVAAWGNNEAAHPRLGIVVGLALLTALSALTSGPIGFVR